MNTSVVHEIETAILQNLEIINLSGDGKDCSHAFVSDNSGSKSRR